MKYRTEIDGLRAIAVLSVIFYHYGLPYITGGFLGVDIFFVISGFLITNIIKDERAKRFSYKNFYSRRIRRLLPALIFLIASLCPLAWFWMQPDEIKVFAFSIISGALFSANIYFWRETNYFNPTAEENPLLHLWSLGVEEQFYLLYPIMLICLLSRNSDNTSKLKTALVLCIAFSLLAAEWGWRNAPAGNFYLLPSRAWELLVGAYAAIISSQGVNTIRSCVKDNFYSILGLGMIVMSLLFFDSGIPTPSTFTLIPVLGTALILIYSNGNTFVNKILSLKILVFIGLLSYSAYLWHQPVWAFSIIMDLNRKIPIWVLIVICFLTAYVSYRFVEKPFRYSRNNDSEGQISSIKFGVMSTIILLCMGGIIYLFPLNDFRLKEDIRRMSEVYRVDLINGNRDFLFLMKESHKFDCNYLDFEYFIKSSGVEKIKDYKLSSDCYPIKEGRGPHYLILGDSHAGHLFEGLVQSIDPMLGFGLFSNSGCSLSSSIGGRQNRCTEGLKRTLETINSAPPHTVILAQRDEFLIDELEKVSRSLIEMGVARVVVLGPVPQYITTVPKIFIRGLMAGTEIAEIEKHVNEYLDPSIIKYDKFMQNKIKTGQYGFDYISVLNIFCSGGKYCKMDFTREEDIYPYLAIYDKNHLTPRAAVYLVDRIMKIL